MTAYKQMMCGSTFVDEKNTEVMVRRVLRRGEMNGYDH